MFRLLAGARQWDGGGRRRCECDSVAAMEAMHLDNGAGVVDLISDGVAMVVFWRDVKRWEGFRRGRDERRLSVVGSYGRRGCSDGRSQGGGYGCGMELVRKREKERLGLGFVLGRR